MNNKPALGVFFACHNNKMFGKRIVAVTVATLLAGCATTNGPAPQTTSSSGLSARHMRLSAHMSSSVFLQPVGPRQRVIFVDGHNTSSAQSIHFGRLIDQRLIAKGYTITNNPRYAHYMLMYNIRYVGKEQDAHAAAGALAGGFGGALIGTAAGNGGNAVAAGAGLGALIGGIIGAVLPTNRYMMVVDIQLEQRQKGAYTSTATLAGQGTNSSVSSSGGGIRGWMIYRDRIVAQASGVRLRFSYATPAMSQEVAGELTGLF